MLFFRGRVSLSARVLILFGAWRLLPLIDVYTGAYSFVPDTPLLHCAIPPHLPPSLACLLSSYSFPPLPSSLPLPSFICISVSRFLPQLSSRLCSYCFFPFINFLLRFLPSFILFLFLRLFHNYQVVCVRVSFPHFPSFPSSFPLFPSFISISVYLFLPQLSCRLRSYFVNSISSFPFFTSSASIIHPFLFLILFHDYCFFVFVF